LKVLIVEDDLSTLELMSEYLRAEGVLVEQQSDTEIAAQRILEETFDFIFLDLQMPKLSGLELAKHVRKSAKNSRTQIAVITGRRERHTLHNAFEAGATWFLSKPIDRKKLLRLVKATPAKSSLSQRAG
jgi:DNA-binding response OmpR family regulator